MATSSTVATVKAQIVNRLASLLAPVPVTYAWPGKSTQPKAVFLGPHPETADIRLDLSSNIPTIKAGRKNRREVYTVRVTAWTFRPDLTSEGAEACETDAFALLAGIEDLFAAGDTRIGLAATVVQQTEITSIASTLFPFQAGWACELSIDVDVTAYLT